MCLHISVAYLNRFFKSFQVGILRYGLEVLFLWFILFKTALWTLHWTLTNNKLTAYSYYFIKFVACFIPNKTGERKPAHFIVLLCDDNNSKLPMKQQYNCHCCFRQINDDKA